jgi:DNA helicase-2/ATP-dependent DNA helicase PcrA
MLVSRLARLAPDQRTAATAPPGPVLCIAPAGSGKTTTLVARIAWRIAHGADPARTCALTFNRGAAAELTARLGDALAEVGVDREAVRVRTFHALGREILAGAGEDVSRLVDRAAILTELVGGPIEGAALVRLDAGFSRITLDPGRGSPRDDDDVLAAYAAYRAALVERNALDFDDLVARALALLREDEGILARWQERCATLLVDEAQDLDRSQLDMALLLVGSDRDIFLVGDDDQTIYAWRLADVRRILGLAAGLPGLRRVDLEVNYRCPPEVVARSVRLVEHGTERFVKRIRAGPTSSGTLTLAGDTGDPVARARRLLDRWYGREGGSYAVLARTNAELAPFAAVALERGLAYHVSEDGLLLDDPRLGDLCEMLRGGDGHARESDMRWLAGLGRLARSHADSPATTTTPEAAPIESALLAWAPAFATPSALAAAMTEARRRRAELRSEEARLKLATVHTTKGLEFDHVAVIGLDHGTFPSERSLAEAPDRARALEEERRLAYVAWTRARRSLLLLYDPWAPSLFLEEAFEPSELNPRT